MAGIEEFLPTRPTLGELTSALVGSFQDRFAIDFKRRVD
jgi:hypothetical protein